MATLSRGAVTGGRDGVHVRHAAAALAVLSLLGACTNGDPDPDPAVPTSGAAVSAETPDDPRCEARDYPCAWSEVTPDVQEATDELAERITSVIGDADTAEEAMAAAETLLADRDDLPEWGVDDDDKSGVMFRLDGGRPAVVSGPNAAGTPSPPSTWTLEGAERRAPPERVGAPEPTAAPASTPAGAATTSLADYRPAGGPDTWPRRALVLDAFPDESCDGLLTGPGGFSCRLTADGLTEGQAVASVIGRDPDYDVDLLRGGQVTPAALMNAGQYDVVHLASHAIRVCGDSIQRHFPSAQPQGDACFSAIHLGKQAIEDAEATLAEWRARAPDDAPTSLAHDAMPSGLVYSNGGWGMTASFLNQVPGLDDSIVYLSACTSADDQVLDRSRLGAFVGWEDSVRLDGALDAAVRFWELMTRHATSVDTAADVLSEEGLDSTWAFPGFDVVVAQMVAESPRNLRARDAITDTVTADERLAVTGTADGDDPVLLRDLTIWVSGVEHGTEQDVAVELRIDDRVVDLDASPVTRYGTEYHEDEGFSHWRLDLEDVELPVDLTAADVDPVNPRPHTWEARAYTDGELYSADRADPVYLGGQVVARADPAPTTFEEYLGATEATVDLSDLYMVLPVAGGEIEGEVDAVYELDGGPPPTRTTLQIRGTLDPDSMRIDGAASSVEGADDLYPMPPVDAILDGVVDLEAGTVEVVIGGTMAWWPEPIRFTADLGSTTPPDLPTPDPDGPNV